MIGYHFCMAPKRQKLTDWTLLMAKNVQRSNHRVYLKDIASISSNLNAAFEKCHRKIVKKADRKAFIEENRAQMKKHELNSGELSSASISDMKRAMEILPQASWTNCAACVSSWKLGTLCRTPDGSD
jgi:hypothetical protein